MRSIILVALQFVLIGVLLWPHGHAEFGAMSLVLVALGMAIGLWALASNRPGNFNIRPDPKRGGVLIEHGPYRYVRHPMYVAVLAFGAGLVAREPEAWRIAAWVALAAVLNTKARFEERAMRDQHPDYDAYCARTARWIPFLR